MNKTLWKIFFIALAVQLTSFWILAIPDTGHEWGKSFTFFCVSLAILEKYGSSQKITNIILWILAGRLILELPMRIFDFMDCLPSFYITVVEILAIIAAGIYYKFRTAYVLIVITIIAVVLNTLIPPVWLKFVESVLHVSYS
ncbi:hypothetical protein [Prevotella sp. KH2C16]|uniref:hypothetical protein n=1 Tax=Prevotella sp. KH2C16 TaxID=1855325 RepID=UPI0008EB5A6E|nr:hypothetical protein [Prevotella sp. KH2C16]SFG04521.1 hypothetical protein SAMN05216383_10473 [Prevotella sp. KH2C16]